MDAQTLKLPDSLSLTTIENIQHWTDSLFSFRAARPASFRFRSGEFIMLGLPVEGKPLLRAYSVASPFWDEGLDFYSIKVQDGPLTSRLQHIKPGDELILGKKPTGTLVLDCLKPGKRLFLFSTGTGIAPFASIIRDPETYEAYDQVILTHTCRQVADLQYGVELINGLKTDPLLSETVLDRVTYYGTTTQEENEYTGRITNLINTGKFFKDLDIDILNPETDRVMICGSMEMIKDTAAIVEEAGLQEGSNSKPGDYVIEKAFAE
ncbi:MAG: ferredoxin--NADP reductase [Pseudomonadota bacterium]|nr:ferredoxin--NADP reductase [Pseudomonadota bacterium]